MTIGRVAHITEGTKPGLGRVNCQYRNIRDQDNTEFAKYFERHASNRYKEYAISFTNHPNKKSRN